MRRINPIALLLLVLALPAAGTAAPSVVVSIKPLQLIVAEVTHGISKPTLLIPANQSYHDFTLRPSTVRALQEADLLVWIGPALETYLQSLAAQHEGEVITVWDLANLTRYPLEKVNAPHERADEAHAESSHGHGDWDGHVWLDTGNALLIAETVAQRLVALDPVNAERYAGNLAAFRARLAADRQAIRSRLEPLQGHSYAVYHDGFQYFERENGLQHNLVFVLTEDMQPGVRHMLALREALQEHQPVCLLKDAGANPATVRTILGDYRLRQEQVDALGADIEPVAGGYSELLSMISTVFQRCIRGG